MSLPELRKKPFGPYYASDISDLKDREVEFCGYNGNIKFYRLLSTDEYIIKKSKFSLSEDEHTMVKRLIRAQGRISKTEFPIGCYFENKQLMGLIVKSYIGGISLKDLIGLNRNIDALKEHFNHSENSIHNVFLLAFAIIEALEEMYVNKVAYYDIKPDNIVLFNNMARFIDFESFRVRTGFGFSKGDIDIVLNNFFVMLREVLSAYNLYDADVQLLLTKFNFPTSDFEKAKRHIKKIEGMCLWMD